MQLRYRCVFILTFALGGCGTPAFPPALIPPRPSADDWPDAGAAVLEDEATIELRLAPPEEGRPPHVLAVLDHRRRLKVLSEQGLSAADVELSLDAFSMVTDLRARSVGPDGREHALAAEDARIVPLVVAGRPTALRVLRFTIPAASVGGILEYRYTRTFSDAAWLPTWIFGGRYPVVRAALSIVHGPEVRVDYRYGRGERVADLLPARSAQADGRERLVLVQQDLPPFYPEPDMPHWARVAPWVAVVVTSARSAAGTRRFETWDDVARFLEILANPVAGPAGDGDLRGRYRRVRDALRIAPVPGLGGLPPTPATRLLGGEPACGRDAAVILRDALRGASAEASLALVAAPSGPPVARDLPGLYGFVAAVVAVRAPGAVLDQGRCGASEASSDPVCRVQAGEWLLLDPACPRCRYGELRGELAGGEAVVLSPGGVEWIGLPVDPPEQHRLSLHYELAFDGDGVLRGEGEGRASGNAATWIGTLLGGSEPDAALASALFGRGSGPKFSGVGIIGASEAEQPLVFGMRVRGRLEKLGYERYRVRPLDLVGPALPVPRRTNRRYAAVLAAPRDLEQVVRLAVPLGYEVEVPPPVRLTTPFADYAASFERRGHMLVYTRRLRLRTPVVHVDRWEDFKQFADQVAAFDSRAVRLSVRDAP